MLGTKQGQLAIKQPEFKKIEIEQTGGLARAVARIELIEIELVMRYKLADVILNPGDKVLLRGDAGGNRWAQQLYRLNDGTPFVLCPEDQVLGYSTKDTGII